MKLFEECIASWEAAPFAVTLDTVGSASSSDHSRAPHNWESASTYCFALMDAFWSAVPA